MHVPWTHYLFVYFSSMSILRASFADFSLITWYNEQGLTYPQTLTQLESSKLLQELGIGDLMSADQCQRSGSQYSPSTDGWKKGTLCLV